MVSADRDETVLTCAMDALTTAQQQQFVDNDCSGDEEGDGAEVGGKKKKKKKKKRSKKKASDIPFSAPTSRILGGSTNYYMKYGQTNPPTIPVWDLFCNAATDVVKPFPVGQIMEHNTTKYPLPVDFSHARLSQEEKL